MPWGVARAACLRHRRWPVDRTGMLLTEDPPGASVS